MESREDVERWGDDGDGEAAEEEEEEEEEEEDEEEAMAEPGTNDTSGNAAGLLERAAMATAV